MEKIDYLETKINEILYELNYIKNYFNSTKHNLEYFQTENYLLNSNFILNQKGAETYENDSGLTSQETADKWILTGVGSYKDAGEISLMQASCFSQFLTKEEGLQSLLNKDVTLTFYVSSFSGTGVKLGSRVWTDETNFTEQTKFVERLGTNSLSFSIPAEAVKLEVFIENQAVEEETAIVILDWAKLEMGTSFTNYIEPSYGKEVLNCNAKNVEYSETFYDMSSEDSSINLGYTSGIKGGTKLTELDFSKYKKIKVYSVIDWDYSNFYIDLRKLVSTYGYYSSSVANPRVSSGTLYIYGCFASVNKDKNNFSIEFFRGSTKFNSNANYYCYKIEGIY